MSIVEIVDDGGVLVVTLNRPASLNALVPESFDALRDVCCRAADPAIGAVLLTGAGAGFCSGADLFIDRTNLLPGSQMLEHRYNPVISELAALDKPVIAAINGAVAGAGLSLAGLADIRICSEKAKFVPGFIDRGLAPDTGSSLFLIRAMGHAAAFRFLAEGRALSAHQALEQRLVNEVVAHESLVDTCLDLAKRLAAKPPQAMISTKRLMLALTSQHLESQLRSEALAYRRLAGSDPHVSPGDRV